MLWKPRVERNHKVLAPLWEPCSIIACRKLKPPRANSGKVRVHARPDFHAARARERRCPPPLPSQGTCLGHAAPHHNHAPIHPLPQPHRLILSPDSLLGWGWTGFSLSGDGACQGQDRTVSLENESNSNRSQGHAGEAVGMGVLCPPCGAVWGPARGVSPTPTQKQLEDSETAA